MGGGGVLLVSSFCFSTRGHSASHHFRKQHFGDHRTHPCFPFKKVNLLKSPQISSNDTDIQLDLINVHSINQKRGLNTNMQTCIDCI